MIILIAWTGLTRPAFMSALAALASAPVLYGIFSRGGHASAGWECLIVTIPVAAALGEILSWSMRRARKMTHLEAQRRLHDALTGAGNRTLLSVQLDHALARVRRSHKALALLQVNLDDFKSVNETMGTFAGDDVLVETAARLRASIRETDTIARIGADEFVVLCEDIDALHFATTIARRILDALSLPFTVESDSVRLTASIGIAFSSDGTETVDTLLQNAGLALYQAKHSGRGRYEVFGEAIRDQIAKRRELEAALARAVSRQELRLHYQPIVESESARVESFEALLRWERPGLGVIPPGDFIPLAEQTGLIVDIGAWVVQEACRQAASWGNERLRS
ncbi:MAG TPA: bifunctional diguanylate cyclase/phosphodiesterase, partial [Candidatus Tumulicola sp.]|nr:bifunctional diguanylate cyclase/phosphodiesterase [Candidatus Tumulicola sp.]